MRPSCARRALAAVLLVLPLANAAFSFTDGPATQCDGFTVTWAGGTAPFSLTLIPIFGTPRNISIPAVSFSAGKGSFSTQMPFAKGQQYMVSMSDATGFGAGGFTTVKTVGDSRGGSCNTTDPGVDFSFQLNTALQQCRPFTFSGYDGAVQPVTIMAIVPGGQAVTMRPPNGPQFNWPVNVASGTQMVFVMTDAAGRQGGSSDVRTVGMTDDASCLNANSPSSTPAPSPTSSAPSGSSSTRPSNSSTSAPDSSGSGGFSVAAIAGTVIGALIFLAVAVTLGLFCLRRSKYGNKEPADRLPSHRGHSTVNLVDGDPNFQPYVGETVHNNPRPTPFLTTGGPYQTPFTPTTLQDPYSSQHDMQQAAYGSQSNLQQGGYQQGRYSAYDQSTGGDTSRYNASSTSASAYSQPQTYGQAPTEFGGNPIIPSAASSYGHRPGGSTDTTPTMGGPANRNSVASTTLTAAQRKAAMAGESAYKPPSRFIVHTDVEDMLPPPNEDGIVELPPQYSERRAPLAPPPATDQESRLPYSSPPPPPGNHYPPTS
ncbi:hypothetical protein HGRIS_007996 [Hohenbuehelia grisea]|uniref:Uncharacterized protein n=1 Tax=Hohenbuehelia grisea TaxID=104357 RepID=A0ABR3J729_9AGAR